MKRRILAVLLCLALLFTMVLASSCSAIKGNSNNTNGKGNQGKTEEELYAELTPNAKLRSSVESTVTKTVEAESDTSLFKGIQTALKTGSIQIDTVADEELGMPRISAKTWQRGDATTAQFEADIDGQTIHAQVWEDISKAIVVKSPEFFGADKTYGINMKTFFSDANAFATTVINKAMEEEGVSEEELPSLLPPVLMNFYNLVSGESNVGFDDLDINKIAEELKAVLLSGLTDSLSVTESKKEVTSLGEKVSATQLTFTVTNETLANALNSMYQSLKQNQELKSALEKLYPVVAPALSATGSQAPETLDAAFEMLNGMVEQAAEQVKNAEEQLSAQVSVFTTSTGLISRVEATVEMMGTSVNVVLELGKDPTQRKGLDLAVKVLPEQGETMECGLTVTNEKTSEGRKISFQTSGLAAMGSTEIDGEFIIRNQGKCEFKGHSVEADGEEMTATVSFNYRTTGNGVHVIDGFEATEDGKAEEGIPDIKITFTEKDDAPAMPENYTNIFTLSMEEMEELMSGMEGLFRSKDPYEDMWEDDMWD